MKRSILLLLCPLVVAASAPVRPSIEPLDAALKSAQAEQAAAERREAALQRQATAARGRVERLRAQQAAAAQAIEAAEARITAADARLRLIAGSMEMRRRQLAREQRPVASLLAGLAVMGQRPPLLALADRTSTDEIVAVRVLLDATLPVIRRRTAALSSEMAADERIERAAAAARSELVASRRSLLARREAFAGLERQALQLASAAGGQALNSGDVALAAGENVEQLRSDKDRSGAARTAARALALQDAAPAGPAVAAPARSNGLIYALPAAAPVVDGLSSVSASGVRSRGIVLATARGSPVFAPAAGTVRFSGPYKDQDGVLIIDHGAGWMTLLLNLSSPLRPGERVRLGDAIGRAMGRITVELSRNGQRVSPALIAGSSQPLSNDGKGG